MASDNLAYRVYRRELGYVHTNNWFLKVPPQLQSHIEAILDADKELKSCVLLGFSRCGDYLISYTSTPVAAAEEDDGDFDASSAAGGLNLTIAESADGNLLVIHGRQEDAECTSGDRIANYMTFLPGPKLAAVLSAIQVAHLSYYTACPHPPFNPFVSVCNWKASQCHEIASHSHQRCTCKLESGAAAIPTHFRLACNLGCGVRVLNVKVTPSLPRRCASNACIAAAAGAACPGASTELLANMAGGGATCNSSQLQHRGPHMQHPQNLQQHQQLGRDTEQHGAQSREEAQCLDTQQEGSPWQQGAVLVGQRGGSGGWQRQWPKACHHTTSMGPCRCESSNVVAARSDASREGQCASLSCPSAPYPAATRRTAGHAAPIPQPILEAEPQNMVWLGNGGGTPSMRIEAEAVELADEQLEAEMSLQYMSISRCPLPRPNRPPRTQHQQPSSPRLDRTREHPPGAPSLGDEAGGACRSSVAVGVSPVGCAIDWEEFIFGAMQQRGLPPSSMSDYGVALISQGTWQAQAGLLFLAVLGFKNEDGRQCRELEESLLIHVSLVTGVAQLVETLHPPYPWHQHLQQRAPPNGAAGVLMLDREAALAADWMRGRLSVPTACRQTLPYVLTNRSVMVVGRSLKHITHPWLPQCILGYGFGRKAQGS